MDYVKDSINVRALNNNTGTIHSSNLCTEITLPNDAKNIAVCNLCEYQPYGISNRETKEWDWKRLRPSSSQCSAPARQPLRHHQHPVVEAINSVQSTRALGLGVMGFTDVVEKMGYSYESEEAYELVDQLVEYISYSAIDESANLAKTRGIYPDFKGSGWSQGLLPIDLVEVHSKDRKLKVNISRKTRMDWETLRKKTKKVCVTPHLWP